MSKNSSLLRRSSAVLLALAAPLLAAAQLIAGPEKALATPELETLARVSGVDTASDGPTIFAVWSDRRTDVGSEIFAARLDRNGRVLDANIPLTATPELAESDPLIEFDGTRYLVVWFDGTNTVAAELTTAGTILTQPTVIAAGRPTSLVRGSRDTAISMVDAGGSTVGVIRPGLEYTQAARLRPNQNVRMVRIDTGYMVFFTEIIQNRAVLRALRVDSRGRVTDTINLGALGSFTPDLTIAVVNVDNVPILAAAARDRLVVARVTPTGVATPLTVIDAVATRSVQEVVPRTGAFDVVMLHNGRPRIMRYTGDTLTLENEPVAGPAVTGSAVITAGRLFTVWQVGGTLTARFAFMQNEPLVRVAQSAPNQQMPLLATDGVAALAVWTEDITETEDRIMARLITRDGTPIAAQPLEISERTMASALSPPAVALHGNNYYIAWVDARNGVDKPAALTMRTVDRGGTLAGDIGVSLTVAPDDTPAIATGGTDALLVWSKAAPSPRVRAAYISNPNQQFEIEELLREPAVAFGNGSYVIVGVTPTGAIRGVRFSDGAVRGTLFQTVPPVNEVDSEPELVWNGSDFLMVFHRGSQIWGRFIGTGFEFPIAESGDNPRVSWDGKVYIATWQDDGDVYAARVSTTGTVETPVELSATSGNEDFPTVIGLGDGTSLAAYQRTVPELHNVHRVFTKVLTTEKPKPTKRRAVR